MKKILSLVLLSVALAFTPACKTKPTTPETQVRVYKTLAGIGESVDVAMRQLASARAQNRITEAQWQQVRQVHTDYVIAYNLAVDAGATSSSPAPDKVIELSARIATLLSAYLPTS